MVFLSVLYLVASVVAGYVVTVVLYKWLSGREQSPAPRSSRSAPGLMQQQQHATQTGKNEADDGVGSPAPETSPRNVVVTKLMMVGVRACVVLF